MWYKKEGWKEKMHNLHLKPIKKLLKQDCPYPVSSEAIILLRDRLEEFAHTIKDQAILEFEKLNRDRRAQGLYPLKRLNALAISRAAEKVFSSEGYSIMGLQSKGATSPGDEMLIDKFVTKPERTTDDDGEVV